MQEMLDVVPRARLAPEAYVAIRRTDIQVALVHRTEVAVYLDSGVRVWDVSLNA